MVIETGMTRGLSPCPPWWPWPSISCIGSLLLGVGIGRQALARGFQRKIDVLFGVGRGNERGFELGGREEHPAIEHVLEVGGISGGVGSLGARVVANRLGREEQGREGAHGVDLRGDLLGPHRFPETS